MRCYIQFFTRSLDGSLIEACGDSGVFILDARNSINTMKQDAENRVTQLRNWKRYKLYEIRRCSKLFEDGTCLYRNFNVEKTLEDNKRKK